MALSHSTIKSWSSRKSTHQVERVQNQSRSERTLKEPLVSWRRDPDSWRTTTIFTNNLMSTQHSPYCMGTVTQHAVAGSRWTSISHRILEDLKIDSPGHLEVQKVMTDYGIEETTKLLMLKWNSTTLASRTLFEERFLEYAVGQHHLWLSGSSPRICLCYGYQLALFDDRLLRNIIQQQITTIKNIEVSLKQQHDCWEWHLTISLLLSFYFSVEENCSIRTAASLYSSSSKS